MQNFRSHLTFTVWCEYRTYFLPYICDHQVGYSAGGYSLSPRWFLTWYIYPIFQDSLHWWVLILHETCDHCFVAVLTVTEHFIYSHFWFFFFKLVAFCTEFNLFTSICFVLYMIMDLPYICDHQVGYSAGGYSLSPRWFLTWYICQFFSGLAALMSADIARNLRSLVCSCLNSYWTFHLFPLLIFFSNWLLSALNSICLPPFVLFSIW